MEHARFNQITGRYPNLDIAVLGDFCLDRYLEIDPHRSELSIETGLPVHNVVRIRAQAGAAGTVLNNLSALGIGTLRPIGFAGEDGEGYELWCALEKLPGVRLDLFLRTAQQRTFTYTKPLVMEPGRPPVELNRFDMKNWNPTPGILQGLLMRNLAAAQQSHAVIVMDQAPLAETGVVTRKVLEALAVLAESKPLMSVLADSRRGFRDYPPVGLKMNASELAAILGRSEMMNLQQISDAAAGLAVERRKCVFVTLAERGLLGAESNGSVASVPAYPVRGPIDIVGAGDAVTANLSAALAAGATMLEALELAAAAASIVIHKLGTTGTASVPELAALLFPEMRKPTEASS